MEAIKMNKMQVLNHFGFFFIASFPFIQNQKDNTVDFFFFKFKIYI